MHGPFRIIGPYGFYPYVCKRRHHTFLGYRHMVFASKPTEHRVLGQGFCIITFRGSIFRHITFFVMDKVSGGSYKEINSHGKARDQLLMASVHSFFLPFRISLALLLRTTDRFKPSLRPQELIFFPRIVRYPLFGWKIEKSIHHCTPTF